MTGSTRRRLLRGLGGATLCSLAGCAGEAGTDDERDTTPTPDVPPAVDDFLVDANGYDGTLADATGRDDVSVAVGGQLFVFDPAAVRVDAGTTVTWEWAGGLHNVVSAGDSEFEIDSGQPTDGTDATVSRTFESTGVALYVCEVHEAGGMLGAVEVV